MHVSDTHETIARDAADVASALAELHRDGISPVQAIKALVTGRGSSLGDAKAALFDSPAWYKELQAADVLHDQILDALDYQADDVGI